jgi:hypothetical protein
MTRIALGGLVTATLLTLPSIATAGACAPREIILDRLASKFGETRQSIGLGPNNQMVEVFASDATGTWTITVTKATGLTCLIASGQAFETLMEALPADEKDA